MRLRLNEAEKKNPPFPAFNPIKVDFSIYIVSASYILKIPP